MRIMSTRRLVLTAAVLGLVIGSAGQARAGLIFDNSAGSSQSQETRPADSMFAAVIQSDHNQHITNFSVQVQANSDGQLKFLIFDSKLDGGTGQVLYSQTVNVTATSHGGDGVNPTPLTYLLSPDLDFTLTAGKDYDIGVLANVSLTGDFDFTGNTQNGITSISQNANFGLFTGGSFANPTTGNSGVADPHLRLYDGLDAPVATPEPSTFVGAGIGVLMLAGMAWRKRRRVAA